MWMVSLHRKFGPMVDVSDSETRKARYNYVSECVTWKVGRLDAVRISGINSYSIMKGLPTCQCNRGATIKSSFNF